MRWSKSHSLANFRELLAGRKLWPVVSNYLFRYAVPCEMRFELSDYTHRCYAYEVDKFKEITEVIGRHQIALSLLREKVSGNVVSGSTRRLVTLECFLGLASLILSTSFTGRYVILDVADNARAMDTRAL